MSWQEKFSREIEPGFHCVICGNQVQSVDYVGYSWECGGGRHTAQQYVKYLMNAETQRRMDTLEEAMRKYRDVVAAPRVSVPYASIKKAASKNWDGWGWSKENWEAWEQRERKEKTDKERIGEDNEFGKICP